MIEHDAWPTIAARWFTAPAADAAPRKIRLIVMHTMESPEKGDTAESVARWLAKTDTKASAHVCVDNNSIVQCVDDMNVAYGAPGANRDGLHVEMAGSFRQTEAQWFDAYTQSMLSYAAEAVAQFCLQYDIPVVHLTDAQLQAGERGIVGHSQVADVYGKNAKPELHRDPGEFFPWDDFISRVTIALNARQARFA